MTGPQSMCIHPGLRPQQTKSQRLLGHFEAEKSNDLQFFNSSISRDVEAESGFPHGRATRNNDQIARLEARRQMIEINKSGRDTRDHLFPLIKILDHFKAMTNNIFQR